MDTISVGKAAERLGVSVGTLQRWDRSGKLRAIRSPFGRRRYRLKDLDRVVGIVRPEQPRRHVAYCRVSSNSQRADLDNQKRTLWSFCTQRGLAVEMLTEIGGGLNFKRKVFLTLLDDIIAGRIATLVLAHKDRFCRFGFDLVRHLCNQHDCELLILDQETLSPEQEMVQDLMTITHCFSSRLYGLRNYRKKLKEALKDKSCT